MEKMKKIGLLLALVLALSSSFMGCSRGSNIKIDDTKTQLYVSSYTGGYGKKWLENVIADFERDYAEVSFESGKKGVQVIPETGKTKANALNLISDSNEVFFSEEVRYFKFASEKQVLDISDVVEEVTAQEGVDLSDLQKSALTQLDGKYYAIPHYETCFGLIYDIDLFETYGFYLLYHEKGDTDFEFKSKKIINSQSLDIAPGPDGEYGTSDDGLPSTMQEFFALCEYMTTKQVSPIILTGQYADRYSANIAIRAQAAYDGIDVSTANYTFDYKNLEYITSVTEDKSSPLGWKYETATADIDVSNAYLLNQTKGRLFGLSFLNQIINGNNGNNLYKSALNSGTTQLMAQETFVNSSFRKKPIAMLVDGIWWENEATDAGVFVNSQKAYGTAAAKSNRHFGMMPFPTKVDDFDDNEGNSNAAYDMYSAYAFIGSYIKPSKIELAKTFLKYCYTLEQLNKFTATTGIPRALDYTLTDATYNNLTSFQKGLWNAHNSGSIIKQLSDKRIYLENEAKFDTLSHVAALTYTYPYAAFASGSPVSVKTYFEGSWKTQSKWDDTYGQYYLQD